MALEKCGWCGALVPSECVVDATFVYFGFIKREKRVCLTCAATLRAERENFVRKLKRLVESVIALLLVAILSGAILSALGNPLAGLVLFDLLFLPLVVAVFGVPYLAYIYKPVVLAPPSTLREKGAE